jgi:hypothetical protein
MNVQITYFGMNGQGKNVTEAKRDAGAKIERAMTGSYDPAIVHYRGHAAIVYRSPDVWHYSLVSDEEGFRERLCTTGAFDDKEVAMQRARYHVAQNAWQLSDGLAVPSFVTDKSDRMNLESLAKFQIRYARARELGMTDTDSHDFAGMNPARPELWANVA